MNYISAKDAAKEWGISTRRVSALCLAKRIPNAEMLGNMWLIPKDAKKPEDARFKPLEKLHPVIKWVGGKGQLLEEIAEKYPKGLGTEIRNYVEPFVGGGAVLFDLLSTYSFENVYISDINAELINLYCMIRDRVNDIITLLRKFEKEFLPMTDEDRKTYYHDRRNEFNNLIEHKNSSNSVIGAALFIFLNRTCFNGLYRVNSKGLYNVPMGAYKNPKICDEENLLKVSRDLRVYSAYIQRISFAK